MTLIVCLDDKGGMMFNKRRQSKDKLLRERVLKISSNSKLWMNSYTAAQFEEEVTNITVDDNFLNKCGKDDYCFAENVKIGESVCKFDRIIVYRWNCTYPSDMKFDISLENGQWKKISVFDFVGNSHLKITEEVYVK